MLERVAGDHRYKNMNCIYTERRKEALREKKKRERAQRTFYHKTKDTISIVSLHKLIDQNVYITQTTLINYLVPTYSEW